MRIAGGLPRLGTEWECQPHLRDAMAPVSTRGNHHLLPVLRVQVPSDTSWGCLHRGRSSDRDPVPEAFGLRHLEHREGRVCVRGIFQPWGYFSLVLLQDVILVWMGQGKGKPFKVQRICSVKGFKLGKAIGLKGIALTKESYMRKD